MGLASINLAIVNNIIVPYRIKEFFSSSSLSIVQGQLYYYVYVVLSLSFKYILHIIAGIFAFSIRNVIESGPNQRLPLCQHIHVHLLNHYNNVHCICIYCRWSTKPVCWCTNWSIATGNYSTAQSCVYTQGTCN